MTFRFCEDLQCRHHGGCRRSCHRRRGGWSLAAAARGQSLGSRPEDGQNGLLLVWAMMTSGHSWSSFTALIKKFVKYLAPSFHSCFILFSGEICDICGTFGWKRVLSGGFIPLDSSLCSDTGLFHPQLDSTAPEHKNKDLNV